jgi:four helix bundle protein
VQDYRQLTVWHRAIDLAIATYELTATFPDPERFGLSSQMRRASVSISSNIAEGCGRSSRADFARFLEFATGSALELESQLEIGARLGYVNGDSVAQATGQIIRMLDSLSRALHNGRDASRAPSTPSATRTR